MTTGKDSGKTPENDKGKDSAMEYEYIDENEIQAVKRGRKAQLDAEMITFLEKAKVGQIVKIRKMAVSSALLTELANEKDAKVREGIVSEIRKEKATNSAKIRTQAKGAGWKKVGIIWDVNGIPCAKRIG